MVGNSQSEFTVKIHTFIPRNSKSHFARAGLKVPTNGKIFSGGFGLFFKAVLRVENCASAKIFSTKS